MFHTWFFSQSEHIAADFWRQGYEVGLGTIFSTLLATFPARGTRELCQMATVLSLASQASANNVLQALKSAPCLAEPLEVRKMLNAIDCEFIAKTYLCKTVSFLHIPVPVAVYS